MFFFYELFSKNKDYQQFDTIKNVKIMNENNILRDWKTFFSAHKTISVITKERKMWEIAS